jgi:hypothetical protein
VRSLFGLLRRSLFVLLDDWSWTKLEVIDRVTYRTWGSGAVDMVSIRRFSANFNCHTAASTASLDLNNLLILTMSTAPEPQVLYKSLQTPEENIDTLGLRHQLPTIS